MLRRGLILAFIVLAFLTGVLLPGALAQTKITIGVAAMSPRTIPLLLAQEQGLFAKQGIDARIVLIKGAPILVASLISGELEMGYTAARPCSVRPHKGHI
jgi:ABC-type nitrate/sulfonate/bicarbonate transport system substrate-binding protein